MDVLPIASDFYSFCVTFLGFCRLLLLRRFIANGFVNVYRILVCKFVCLIVPVPLYNRGKLKNGNGISSGIEAGSAFLEREKMRIEIFDISKLFLLIASFDREC